MRFTAALSSLAIAGMAFVTPALAQAASVNSANAAANANAQTSSNVLGGALVPSQSFYSPYSTVVPASNISYNNASANANATAVSNVSGGYGGYVVPTTSYVPYVNSYGLGSCCNAVPSSSSLLQQISSGFPFSHSGVQQTIIGSSPVVGGLGCGTTLSLPSPCCGSSLSLATPCGLSVPWMSGINNIASMFGCDY